MTKTNPIDDLFSEYIIKRAEARENFIASYLKATGLRITEIVLVEQHFDDRIEFRCEKKDMPTNHPTNPPPVTGKTDVYPIVIQDIEERVVAGEMRYGTVLQTQNGRDALWDAYEECLDLVMYLRQAILERDGK